MVLHADGNSFYASCEQIYRPDLRGKPVAVLSNNDGIIIALMLKHMPLCDAKRLLTIQGFATVQELNGIRSVEKVTREKKDIITSSRQFSIKVYDMATIECAMVEYTEIAVERATATRL